MKRRIDALKQLQVKCAHIEAKFYEEVHDLERKYAALYQPLFDKVGRLYLCHLLAESVLLHIDNFTSSMTFLIFLTQRREFINGEAEPTDAESEWHSENEEEEKLAVSTSWVMNYRCTGSSELIPVQHLPLTDS